jgi:RNA polymerase sigma-70 factor (ECF subfamily)
MSYRAGVDPIAELCARARAAHPDLALDDGVLAASITRHIGDGDPAAFCAGCRIDELAMADLAAAGDSAAIAKLERQCATTLAAVTRRFAIPGHGADDLLQTLRTKLYVPPAALALYNGQGSLDSWLRVIATRLFIDLTRRKDRARELPADGELELVAASDLSLDAVKAEYRDAVAAALVDAVRALEPGDRHLLRQHLVSNLTIDQLGTVLGIHRATAARRLSRARDDLAAKTRELLGARLRLDERELSDMLGLVMSNLDISIGKLLASRPAD